MYTLYYAPDNASLAVRMALEELGAPYETRLVDRAAREQDGAAYRRLNPAGLIPVCVMDGVPVAETGAILLALAERHGQLAPAPNEPGRAKVLQWLFFLSNTVHTDLRQLFYAEKFVDRNEAAFRAGARARLTAHFSIFDAEIERIAAPYLAGETPGIVDIYLAVCLRWAQIYPMAAPRQIALDGTPALKAMLTRLEARPAIARACAAEGIAMPCFTAPRYADPPEGSAT